MARSHTVWLAVSFAALVLAGSGCGGRNAKPVPVEGVVTFNGEPVKGATITFLPDGDGGVQAVGRTGSNGVFRLMTFTSGDGAIPGSYKVVITKTEPPEGAIQLDPKKPDEMMKNYYKMMGGPHNMASKPQKSAFPTTYGDAAKTPLKCRVPTDGKVTFALRSDGGS
jgi:hypothetical protein